MTHRRGLALLLLFVLAACQPASPNVPAIPSPTPTAASVSTLPPGTGIGIPEEALKGVSIRIWMPWFGADSSLFVSQVNDFNASNPWGIQAETVSQSNYAELYNKVTAALTTPDRPQIAIAFPEHARAWDSSGQVVDLARYLADSRYGLSEEDARDFPPVFWSQDMVGPKRLGMPAERTARFLLYNVGWARELGFASAPANSSNFRQQACRAHQTMLADSDRKNDGQGGWLVDASATSFMSWLTAFGGGITEGSSYRFLTPKNLAALTFIKQLYDDSCSWSAQPGADLPGVFAARKALFVTASLEQLPDYSRAMASAGNTDEWTVLAFPGQSQMGLIVYGSSYVVLKSSPEQQLASWLFIRWLLTPENQKKWVEVEGVFPLRNSASALLGDYQKSHPQWAQAVALLPGAQGEPQLPSWRKVRLMIGDGFDAMFRSNTPAGRVAEILAIMETTTRDLTK